LTDQNKIPRKEKLFEQFKQMYPFEHNQIKNIEQYIQFETRKTLFFICSVQQMGGKKHTFVQNESSIGEIDFFWLKQLSWVKPRALITKFFGEGGF